MKFLSRNDALSLGLQNRIEIVNHLLQCVSEVHLSRRKRTKQHEGLCKSSGRFREKYPELPSRAVVLHDFRIACRRCETALTVLEHHSQHRDVSWLLRRLKDVRDRCNPVCDSEVFVKWLLNQPPSPTQQQLVQSTTTEIKNGYPIVSRAAKALLNSHRLKRILRSFISSHAEHSNVASDGGRSDYNSVLGSQELAPRPDITRTRNHQLARWLFSNINQFVQSLPDDSHDFDEMHEFRIATKRLRYAMEFMIETIPGVDLTESIQLLEQAQEQLGDVHDAEVRQNRLQDEQSEVDNLTPFLRAAREEARHHEQQWKTWWKPSKFQNILCQSAAAISQLFH